MSARYRTFYIHSVAHPMPHPPTHAETETRVREGEGMLSFFFRTHMHI